MDPEPRPRVDFANFYRQTVGALRRRLARMLRDNSEAEDIAHDAYLRVYEADRTTEVREPAALLFTTARNLAINRINRRHRGPISDAAPAFDQISANEAGVVNRVIARQELQRLQDAIAQLPAGCRAVLLLRKIELLSHQEIAARLGIAVSTVEKQHARALRLLRSAMALQEVPASAARPKTEIRT
jgi:RNA polymerase sigma factor (sigma-70 family)